MLRRYLLVSSIYILKLFTYNNLVDQYYSIISTNDSDQTFSTNPSRGPIPVWNQTFSMPVRSFGSEIKIELLKYDQYKINGKVLKNYK